MMFHWSLKMKFKLPCNLPILLGIMILHQAKSQRPTFAENSWTLKPNVVVVDVNGSLVQYPLSCRGSFNKEEEGWMKDNDLVWRRDGEEEDIIWRENGVETKRGNSFLVNLEERLGGGNFTCHELDGSLLKETMLLVKHLDKKKLILKEFHGIGYMKCSTSKHQEMFQCSWKCSPTRLCTVMSIKVARGHHHDVEDINCNVDASGQHWTCSAAKGNSDIVCSVDSGGQRVSCKDRHYCPYAEEMDRITLTMYIRSKHVLEEYSHKFYLSEIVKPDRVSIKKVNSSAIEWSYPDSWNRPSSYYPLTFQVKVMKGKQRSLECTCEASCAKAKVYTTESTQWSVKRKETVCVRAQDALCNSLWSDWEEYRYRKKGSKREKQIKQKKTNSSQ